MVCAGAVVLWIEWSIHRLTTGAPWRSPRAHFIPLEQTTNPARAVSFPRPCSSHPTPQGKEVNQKTITEFAWETLNSGKVRPPALPLSLSSLSMRLSSLPPA